MRRPRRSPPASTIGGTPASQAAAASTQRGEKLHVVGTVDRRGGAPGIAQQQQLDLHGRMQRDGRLVGRG